MKAFVSTVAIVIIIGATQLAGAADKVRKEIVKARVQHAEEIKSAQNTYKMARRRSDAKVSKIYKQAMAFLLKSGRRDEVPKLRKEMEDFIALQKKLDPAEPEKGPKSEVAAKKPETAKVINERKPEDIAKMVVSALETAAALDTEAKRKTIEIEGVTKIARAIHGATVTIGFPIEGLRELNSSRGRLPMYRLSLKFPPDASVRHGNRTEISSMGSIDLPLSRKSVLSISKGDYLMINGKAYLSEKSPGFDNGLWILRFMSTATYKRYYLCLGSKYSVKVIKPSENEPETILDSDLPRFPKFD